MNDSIPLITRPRIVVPRRRDELLTRSRLLDKLMNQLGSRLVIIAAPAGYGKTSLLVDFVHHLEWPACWYAIDELDCDPTRFIAHFISALQLRFPQFGHSVMDMLRGSTQERLNLDLLVAATVNEVYDNIPEHFMFVLDDYHLVDESRPVNQFVSRFLQAVSENCHMCIASRTLLTLPDLSLLVARAEVGGLSVDDLSFQWDEIQALFLQNQRQVLPTDMARELAKKTEGWISGVLLTSQLTSGQFPASKGALKAAGVDLYSYLAQQVLEKQPAAIQEFLLRTSLLEEFTAEFCAEVIGPALNITLDWEALMDAALRSNLFILPVEEESVWLRYHHLFLEFLRQRMQQQRPEEATNIQARLAQVYAWRGDWERAYRVYQHLGRLTAQIGLLEQAGPELMNSGRFNTLSDWLVNLPEDMRLARPVLLSLQGALAIMRGETLAAQTLLDQAIHGLRPSEDHYQLSLALSRRSVGQRVLGDFSGALLNADEALQVAGKINGQNRASAEAQRARGMALLSMGEAQPAFEQLTKAHAAFQSLGDIESAARLLLEIGMARRRLGQLDEAEFAYTEALNLWESKGNLAWQANLLNNLGVLQSERGDYLAAAHSLERSVEMARLAGYPRVEAFALASLGDLYRDLEAHNEATEAYRQSGSLAGRVNERYLVFYLDLARAVLARRQKQFNKAQEYLTSAASQAQDGLSATDQALCVLEQATLALLQEKSNAMTGSLEEAANLFSRQGARVEAARCQLLLMLGAAIQEHTPAIRFHHQAYMEIWETPAPWPPLVSAAREMHDLLEHYHVLPQLEPLAGRLLRQVDELNQRLPGLRRQLRPQAAVVPLGPAQMIVTALGRLEVWVNHRLVTTSDWRSVVARDLFFFLLAHPQGLTKEQIGLVFWPDASPDQLLQRFRNLIYRLRHAAGREAVVLGPNEHYFFNHALDYDYDVETFERELQLAEKAHAPDVRMRHLLKATRLVKGPYLPEVGAEWALIERVRLQQRYLDALIDAAGLALEAKHPEQALQLCQQVLSVDSGHEEAHRLAMRSYAAEGDRAGVIRQFKACCQAMQEEYAADPSPQTVELYEELTR